MPLLLLSNCRYHHWHVYNQKNQRRQFPSNGRFNGICSGLSANNQAARTLPIVHSRPRDSHCAGHRISDRTSAQFFWLGKSSIRYAGPVAFSHGSRSFCPTYLAAEFTTRSGTRLWCRLLVHARCPANDPVFRYNTEWIWRMC